MLLGLILVNPTLLDEIFAEGQICENLIFHFPVQRNIVHLSLAGVSNRPLFFIMKLLLAEAPMCSCASTGFTAFVFFSLLYFNVIIYYCPLLISSLLYLVERNLDLKICQE